MIAGAFLLVCVYLCNSKYHSSDTFPTWQPECWGWGPTTGLSQVAPDTLRHCAKNINYSAKKRKSEGGPGTSAALAGLHQLPTILRKVSQTFLLQAACCLPQSPGLLAGWLSCDMEELVGLHGYSNPLVGEEPNECKAGSVSFPQPLVPCGTGMSAVSWAFSGRKDLRNC